MYCCLQMLVTTKRSMSLDFKAYKLLLINTKTQHDEQYITIWRMPFITKYVFTTYNKIHYKLL